MIVYSTQGCHSIKSIDSIQRHGIQRQLKILFLLCSIRVHVKVQACSLPQRVVALVVLKILSMPVSDRNVLIRSKSLRIRTVRLEVSGTEVDKHDMSPLCFLPCSESLFNRFLDNESWLFDANIRSPLR